MKKHIILLLMLLWLFPGCMSRKHYQQKDYSFYAKDFTLDNSALLQTDGVYISEQTDQHREVQKDKKLYKFYPGGQVNMIINDQNELNTTADYSNAFNRSNDRTCSQREGHCLKDITGWQVIELFSN